MPPERHSAPPPRPPRDRHPGGGFAGPRRNFGGGGFGGGGPREGGPRPPFTPRPPAPPHVEPTQSVRLREGDREAEIHGNAAFVRQTLDDLPALFARLRGEAPAPSRPASISMPKRPQSQPAAHAEPDLDELEDDLDAAEDDEDDLPEPPRGGRRERHAPKAAPQAAANGNGALEARVFRALKRADHPLSVAAIRKQIGGDTTGQQIRRILERASDRVVATSERPAAYALR